MSKNINKYNTMPNCLPSNPKEIAYILAKLYYEKGRSVKPNEKDIKDIKRMLSPIDIKNVWDAVQNLLKHERILPEGNRLSLIALRQNLLHDIDYFKHIDKNKLISLGQDQQFTREVAIALIRCHLMEKKVADPFAKSEFKYSLLKTGGSQENYTYFHRFLSRCHSMPIDDIVTLSKSKVGVAKIVLNDLSTTAHYFSISAQLATCHPSLRNSIANQWKNKLSTFPLNPSQQNHISELLNSLKVRYPEFTNVNIDSRTQRAQPLGEDEYEIPLWQLAVGIGAGIGAGTLILYSAPVSIPYLVSSGSAAAAGTAIEAAPAAAAASAAIEAAPAAAAAMAARALPAAVAVANVLKFRLGF